MNAEAFERLQVPEPIPTRVSQPFWDAAAGHMLKMQRCEDCRMWVFYPRSHCPHCWSPRLEWAQTSGRGELETFSTVHRPGHPAWQAVAPYPLGVIRLHEGPTMLATLVDVEPDDLYLGMLVQARFVRVGEFTLPMFAPVGGPAR